MVIPCDNCIHRTNWDEVPKERVWHKSLYYDAQIDIHVKCAKQERSYDMRITKGDTVSCGGYFPISPLKKAIERINRGKT